MARKYSFQKYDGKTMARAVGVSLPISFKQAREICHLLKNKRVDDAKKILNRVLEKKQAVPFGRFNRDVGHKPGRIAAGRYPQKASGEILELVNSVEANANNKGLGNTSIIHMNSHKAPSHPRAGRTDGEGKRSHVEIVVGEKTK
jgi:large subunit ribosomal protein L22